MEFLLLRQSGQHGQESAVKTFHLSIALRVVWRCAGVWANHRAVQASGITGSQTPLLGHGVSCLGTQSVR